MNNILTVDHLNIGFKQSYGRTSVIDDISFVLEEGQTLCIVGESGCGKSLTSLAIMGLLPSGGKIINGHILYKGKDISRQGQKELSKIRGKEISMIFQEPMTALNPLHSIGHQIAEVLRIHTRISKHEAKEQTIHMLKLVGIPSPEKRYGQYPHELSGGMRQRVMIAMALICHPGLLIADEPTTALDVTIQAQILELIQNLKDQFNMSLLLITHDLGVVSEVADKVIVMYAGQVVEYGNTKQLFNDPKHPYTKGLINSIPRLDETREVLPTIKGTVPGPDEMPRGCRFVSRCPFAMDICAKAKPPEFTDGHEVHCWLYSSKVVKGSESPCR
ncbi:ABC transporter ATP-binding protein [Sporolactobacillus sp. Y61]|jgi:oligopeptide/dipeptide ABC transporter ATP-binding protein|uniref:ABC transporter ATP-binding protein n=1 Tax=Sporolactobacillus sp. Y61 TaxID=3160863 RepID=A0AAU8IIT6_9BACL|nr:ABC transporter ATP-binding protein [Sporolactobacillus sp. THM19-2]RYL93980.1 ABC transporter ATP-binding protein [Sporolactobacillus sp. THM19-2]